MITNNEIIELIKIADKFKRIHNYWYKNAKFWLSIENILYFGYFDRFNCFNGCSAGELLKHKDKSITSCFRLSAKEITIENLIQSVAG